MKKEDDEKGMYRCNNVSYCGANDNKCHGYRKTNPVDTGDTN